MAIDPGYSRIRFKRDTTIEGYLFPAGVEQEIPDTVLTACCGPLEGNPAFEVLENGHAQYNAAKRLGRAPVAEPAPAPASDPVPASKQKARK